MGSGSPKTEWSGFCAIFRPVFLRQVRVWHIQNVLLMINEKVNHYRNRHTVTNKNGCGVNSCDCQLPVWCAENFVGWPVIRGLSWGVSAVIEFFPPDRVSIAVQTCRAHKTTDWQNRHSGTIWRTVSSCKVRFCLCWICRDSDTRWLRGARNECLFVSDSTRFFFAGLHYQEQVS